MTERSPSDSGRNLVLGRCAGLVLTASPRHVGCKKCRSRILKKTRVTVEFDREGARFLDHRKLLQTSEHVMDDNEHVAIRVVTPAFPCPNFCISPSGRGGERVEGIEPSWPAWKAGALPLSYTRLTVEVWRHRPDCSSPFSNFPKSARLAGA